MPGNHLTCCTQSRAFSLLVEGASSRSAHHTRPIFAIVVVCYISVHVPAQPGTLAATRQHGSLRQQQVPRTALHATDLHQTITDQPLRPTTKPSQFPCAKKHGHIHFWRKMLTRDFQGGERKATVPSFA